MSRGRAMAEVQGGISANQRTKELNGADCTSAATAVAAMVTADV